MMRDLPSRYNHLVVKRAAVSSFLLSLASLPFAARPGQPLSDPIAAVIGKTMVVIPFENTSPTPGLEWLGESFPKLSMSNSILRFYTWPAVRSGCAPTIARAFPPGVHASRATLYRLAEQMDVDYACSALTNTMARA
jgi:hypothetical protein